MKGLIYKDISIFFKSIDRKLILIAVGVILLLMFNSGPYAGLLTTVMLAMTIGMQNVMGFATDEKADWKKYQLAMPVSAFSVVASKYLAVVCTLAISLVGSVLLNLLCSLRLQAFDAMIWETSAAVAVIVPLLWTEVCLPLTYWFGFRSAQTMGMLVVIPMFYIIKYFEDGAGFSAMTSSILSYVSVAGIVVAILFLVSMFISIVGYGRRK